MNELLERLGSLSDEERRSLLAFMAGMYTQTLTQALNVWEQKVKAL